LGTNVDTATPTALKQKAAVAMVTANARYRPGKVTP